MITSGNYPFALAINLAKIAHNMGIAERVKQLMDMCHPTTLEETNQYNAARVEFGLVK